MSDQKDVSFLNTANPLKLNGRQTKALQQTLVAAFDLSSLRMLVRFELDERLETICADKNMNHVVFELIMWAERMGKMRLLIRAAHQENPNNSALKRFVQELARASREISSEKISEEPEEPRKVTIETAPKRIYPAERRQQKAVEFRKSLDWVKIPAGDFLMGSDPSKDKKAGDNETPQHTLHLRDFWITRTAVTNAQYKQFVEVTGYRTTAEEEGSAFAWTGSEWDDVKGANWQHPRGPKSDISQKSDHPVVCISWHDAVAFCQWAGVRLPSEAEWEKAARGPDGHIYPWGNQTPNAFRCNFNMNVGDTTAVGSYPAGVHGLYDMAGNVWEWTSTLWGFEYPYRADDGREDQTAGDGWRVLRGGSFLNLDINSRCAARIDYSPLNRYFDIGFRSVVAPLPLKAEASG